MLSVDGLGLDGEAFAFRLLDEEQVAVMPGAASVSYTHLTLPTSDLV